MSARAKPRLRLVTAVEPASSPAPPALRERAWSLLYRPGQINACPGCGRSQWHVGRTLAECAFCETALPLGGC